MVFKADTIPILIDYFSCIIHIRILVDDHRRWLQHVDEEDAEEDADQKRQELQIIEKFHGNPTVTRDKIFTQDKKTEMVNYWALMENPWLAATLSFFIGFGIAAMFRPMCRGPECIVLHGPPVKDVLDKVYQMGEKCVEFTTEVVPCPEDSKDVVKTVKFISA